MKNAMIGSPLPFVSILTPIYNGEKYLAECIESVLAQTFQNWEYIIVNNCSTDRSLVIAEHYARKDPRIRVLTNTTFVGVIENHNIAFGLISPQSKYCKVVSADDWITPDCVSRMVGLMETNPAIAIVGSYQRKGNEVQWKGLSPNIEVFSGREVCRMALVEDRAIFGPPTSSLYRSDLTRKNERFFPISQPHADICACYEYLQHYDFGFVHEILSTERVHNDRVSTKVGELYMDAVAEVEYVLRYGTIYLKEVELNMMLNRAFAIYYRRLGGSVLKMKGKEFWRFHVTRMRELGNPISWRKVAYATITEIINEMRNPKISYQKLVGVLKEKYFESVKTHH
jgi:glycosyltransferase involved in cell wall biosynthesis